MTIFSIVNAKFINIYQIDQMIDDRYQQRIGRCVAILIQTRYVVAFRRVERCDGRTTKVAIHRCFCNKRNSETTATG
jgi:hypothetical protein